MPTYFNDDESRLPDETSITTESETTKEETPAAKKERERVEKLLKTARRQFRTSASGLQFYREQAADDAKFRAGTWGQKSYQWHPGIQEQREAEKRPCMTINRMPTFIRQVTNQVRAAHYRIKVKPANGKGDPKIAEVLQGLIRNVEVNSMADWVYNTASDKQAEGGLGFFRLITEWEDEDGTGDEDGLFRQRLRLVRERRPQSVYPDLRANNPDFSDGKFLFKTTDLDADDYEDIAGTKPVASEQTTFATDGDQTGDWFPNGKHRIAEWFNLEPKGEKTRKALLASGRVIDYPATADEADVVKAQQKESNDPIVRDRWVQPHVMMWRKITATSILEETEWPAKASPFFGVPGDELEIDGVRDWRGVVRDSKEPGCMYNVHTSALTEQVGLGGKSAFIGYRGQFGEPETKIRRSWEEARTRPHVFHEVEHIDIDGKPAPIPRLESFDAPIGATIEALHQADQDLKTTAGFHEASLAEQGPQESGRAIDARKVQDEIGSSHYGDNLRLSMASAGRQMIRTLRVICDVPTVHRITGNDDKEKNVMVYSGADNDPRAAQYLATHPGPAPLTLPDGKTVVQPGQKIPFQLPDDVKEIYDISVGEFDVEVSAGKDQGTKREQSLDRVTEIMKGLPPELSSKFLDLYFLLFDEGFGQQFSERAKKAIPGLADEEGTDNLPPEAQAKMAQAKQIIQGLQQEMTQLKQALETKQLEWQAKERIAAAANASKEKIAGLQEQADLIKTEAEIQAEQALADIQARLDGFKTTIGLLHEQRMAGLTRAHEASQSAHDRAHEIATTLSTTPPPGPEIPEPHELGGGTE